MLRLRASSSYPLFTGETGLTAKQQQTLDSLLAKIKLTDKQAITRDELIVKRDAPYQLSAGARTLVEKAIEQDIWGYSPSFFSKETTKGNMVEDESILLLSKWTSRHRGYTQQKGSGYKVSMVKRYIPQDY
jgi:hypothetical protein